MSSRDNQTSSNGGDRDRRDDRRDSRERGRERSSERKDGPSGNDRSSRDDSRGSRPPRDALNGHQATADGRFSGTSARYEGKADGIEKRIFIGSLDGETTRDDKIIRQAFEQYGRIMSLNVKTGFAFLEYEREEEAKAAVQNLDGKRVGTSDNIKVNHARGPGVAPGFVSRCYQCGKDGHFARACKSGDGSSARCYKCGSRSHIERHCTAGGRRSRSRSRSRDRRRSRSRSHGRRSDRRSSRSPRRDDRRRSRSRDRGTSDKQRDDKRRSRTPEKKPSSSHRGGDDRRRGSRSPGRK